MGGTEKGVWWGCYMIAKDLRRKKKFSNFFIAMSFTQSVSHNTARLIKFTRETKRSKWKDPPDIKRVTAPEGQRDCTQNCFLVDDEKVLVVGNYLTLFDYVTLD